MLNLKFIKKYKRNINTFVPRNSRNFHKDSALKSRYFALIIIDIHPYNLTIINFQFKSKIIFSF